ncbi:hypothetical protein LPJ53_002457 [Coemansia erecta]|uniref:Uncharacterized protein n=1 Tax=Coemansia erecta TaxID=147472 RepID=A0A9W7Y498_9FUNG|nr:hypothetical protein LPJ53_002457 [Coemansia erecta]
MPGENSTKQNKKRPMGLKARAAKKQKTDEEVTSGGAQVVDDFGDSNTATIMLKDDGEAANEIDELEGIYSGALEALDADEDPERAITLLRGTIHECDRILRVHDEEQQGKKDGEPLEPRFYYIYGMALFSISELAEMEDKSEYLQLAKDRLEQAKELMGDELRFKVLEGLAKVELELFAEMDARDEGKIKDVESRLVLALGALPKDLPEQLVAESLGIFDLVLSLIDSRRLSEGASFKLLSWVDGAIVHLPDAETNSEIRTVQGRSKWVFSGILLDQQDEETGNVPRKDDLLKSLGDASAILQGIESVEALLLRGEVLLNLGNIVDGEEQQEKHYAEAVQIFKQVQEKDELPEQFVQFLEDFEAEED